MNAATPTTSEAEIEAAIREIAARQRELRAELARMDQEMANRVTQLIAIRSES